MYFVKAIKLHERLDGIVPLLLSVEWCALRLLLLIVLDPFIYVQKKVESNYVPGSQIVPLIWDLHTKLMDVVDGLLEPATDEDETKSRTHELCSHRGVMNLASRYIRGGGRVRHGAYIPNKS